jgi:hypothetical protein
MNSIRNLEALMKISLSESERKLITISNVHILSLKSHKLSFGFYKFYNVRIYII